MSIVANTRAVSLIELLVALLLLSFTSLAVVTTMLTSERIGRRVEAGLRVDPDRWKRYRELEISASCADTNGFRVVPLTFPATSVRPSFIGALACGN